MKRLLVCVYLLIIVSDGIAANNQTVMQSLKDYEEFKESVSSFPYSISAERKDSILKNYKNLHVGITKEQVYALLGKPDYSQTLLGPKGPGEKWLGSKWTYVFLMNEETTDANIEIYFGTDELTYWIVPTSMDVLPEIGACCKKIR
jgi:hypothetical protein